MQNLLLGIPISTVVFLIPLLPFLGACFNGLVALMCRSGKAPIPKPLVTLVAVTMPVLAFALTLWLFFFAKDPATGFTTPPLWNWIAVDDFVAGISFKVDRLSLVMGLVITGVGSLIHIYSTGYMSHDAGYARYFTFLNLFLFAMLILVFAGNLPLMFVGWEGVGMCSYFLIGFWFDDPQKAAAGKKAFIVNRVGDFGFLLAMFLMYQTLSQKGLTSGLGFLSFDTLERYRGDLFLVATPVCLLLFVGAMGKSAQIPLYVWLPDAMAGPTPVSALIHAATMVTAGVYMIARLNFLYTLSPTVMGFVAAIGMATALFAALIAIVQSDIKKVLAYSTVSQLGFMFYAVGVGSFAAGVFHLMTHAFFKACLFLGSGSVIHGLHGEQNIWKMGGLKSKMPVTAWTFGLSVLAIAGMFPFAGFFSKDAILFHGYVLGPRVLWGMGFLTAGLTAFYMTRVFALTFLGQPRDLHLHEHAHESPPSMTFALIVLALLAVAGGWVGIPESLHGNDLFFKWLAPLFPYPEYWEKIEHAGHGTELTLSFVTLLWAFHCALVSFVIYSQKLNLAKNLALKCPRLHSLLENKFYVDEIYQALIVKPLGWISEKILWRFADQKVIDSLFVEGTAQTLSLAGRTLSLLQSGVVQMYAILFAIGGLALIAYFVF